MRQIPFQPVTPPAASPTPPEVKPPATATAEAGNVIDLTAFLKQEPRRETIPPITTNGQQEHQEEDDDSTQEQEKPKQEGAESPGPAQEPSATFENGQPQGQYEKFKEQVVRPKLKEYAIKPEKLASFLVKMFNGARCFFLPGWYERAMFNRADVEDLKAALEKRVKAEKANKEPEINNHEKRLLKDYDKLREAQLNVSYTQEEIQELANILAKRLADMDIPLWMEQYDWLIFLLYLEWTHAENIIYTRAGNAINKKLGLQQ